MGKFDGKRFANTIYLHNDDGEDDVLLRGEDAGDYDSALVQRAYDGNPDVFVDESQALDADTSQMTVKEVVAWVDDEPDRARAAIENEFQRDGGPRTGLQRKLEKIVDDGE